MTFGHALAIVLREGRMIDVDVVEVKNCGYSLWESHKKLFYSRTNSSVWMKRTTILILED